MLFSLTLLQSFLEVQSDNKHVNGCMRIHCIACYKLPLVFSPL